MVNILDADRGHWAWGHGDSQGKVVAPIGIIMAGYLPSDRGAFQRMGTDPRMELEFRQVIANKMNGEPPAFCFKERVDDVGAMVRLRHREYFQSLGLDSWFTRFDSSHINYVEHFDCSFDR